jgi:hypothetical protein
VGINESGGATNHKDDDCRLNIFQMTTSNNEHVKDLMLKKLLDF